MEKYRKVISIDSDRVSTQYNLVEGPYHVLCADFEKIGYKLLEIRSLKRTYIEGHLCTGALSGCLFGWRSGLMDYDLPDYLYTFECEEGHTFYTSAINVEEMHKFYCPECFPYPNKLLGFSGNEGLTKSKIIKKEVKRLGFTGLDGSGPEDWEDDDEYLNSDCGKVAVSLRLQCGKGHVFTVSDPATSLPLMEGCPFEGREKRMKASKKERDVVNMLVSLKHLNLDFDE